MNRPGIGARETWALRLEEGSVAGAGFAVLCKTWTEVEKVNERTAVAREKGIGASKEVK